MLAMASGVSDMACYAQEGRPEKEIVEGMMDLEAFPESLETKYASCTVDILDTRH
jgi:hypothetical protein